MFRKSCILLPTDFSPYALHAMKYALAIAKAYEGRVHFLHVIDEALVSGGHAHGLWLTKGDADALVASMKDHAGNRLEMLTRIADDQGVVCSSYTVVGKPQDEILNHVRDHGCTLVVLATHGRSGFDHMVFGSVAEKVVRQSPVPVLCIKHPEHEFVNDEDLSLKIKRILFPTDFSPFADKALPFAVSLCREFHASLVLFHASELSVALPEFMPDAALTIGTTMEATAREALDRMKDSIEDVEVEVAAVTGVPHREICRLVERLPVDLIVMPTHGRSGIGHILFGSVAEKVVRLAGCPVFTIRPEWEGPEPQAE
ncbi:MAG: universal stress protein [Candidatus Hydrogenedentales bacterium]|jgi:nucleotide-binding universal stress UspA family protein